MKLDIDILKDKVKISDSFPELCRNLGLDPNKGNARSNIERYCKRHSVDCNHFRTVKMIKDSKERYNYDKLKILVEKCNTLKEILLELDLLPVTTNYRKIKSMLEKYNLELVYRPIYQQNKTLKTKYTEIELRRVVENSHTYTECFDKLGIRANYQHLKKNIEKYGIDISHFNQYYNYGNRDSKFKADLTSVLKENSTYSRKNLKKKVI